jgi:formate dehydrogenase (coenzyme F420) beta subunit
MATTAKITVENNNILKSLQVFFESILRQENISAILIPQKLPMKNVVMPTLVTDPENLVDIDPLAPIFPMNAGRVAAKLTRKPIGGKIVVVLRPCEIRAFVELVKLKQANPDEIVLVGVDCLGAYQNRDYFQIVGDDFGETTRTFYRNALSGKGTARGDIEISHACRACEYPIPQNADVLIGLLGVDIDNELLVQAQTKKGDDLLNNLNLSGSDVPSRRKSTIETLIEERIAYRNAMFEKTQQHINSIEKLTTYFANCVNCYNCRVACPVCYCKECVFCTDAFDHEPSQYLQWSKRKGIIKMPTDTLFFHLTRLAHMSTACVGCGQCSNACPNDIPVMEVFRTVSRKTQKAFNYEAGRDMDEKPPLSEFREDEFTDVVGLHG